MLNIILRPRASHFSDYAVNAMNADDLRKSQRRYKKRAGGVGGPGSALGDSHATLTTPSQESDLDDEEDEEVLTPGADGPRKGSRGNLFSMRYVGWVDLEKCVFFFSLFLSWVHYVRLSDSR